MPATQFRQEYIDEFIYGFEARTSVLRQAVTLESNVRGNTAYFLVIDSGGASAVTRGANGLIPARNNNLNAPSATLQDWHDLIQLTKFAADMGQANQRKAMQDSVMAVINRKIDSDIISQLDTATNNTGTTATASLAMIAKAKTKLGNAGVNVSDEDNMFALVSPAFTNYLMQITQFSSADYVEVKPFSSGAASKKVRRWHGINWVESPLVSGVGTNSEKCYLFHREAIGHAVDKESIDVEVGYEPMQAFYYARASANMGSKLLQQSGVIQMIHDGSALA